MGMPSRGGLGLVAPEDAREQARVIDVLCEMAGAIEEQGSYMDRLPEVR